MRVVFPSRQLPEATREGVAFYWIHHAPKGPLGRFVCALYRRLVLPHADWILSHPRACRPLKPIFHLIVRAAARNLGVDLS